MKVLQMVPYYAPAWAYGGPPKVMWEEARALVARGHELTVFTSDTIDEHTRAGGPVASVEQGVTIHRFPNVSNYLAYHHYRFSPRGLLGAIRSSEPPDVIHLSETRHEFAIGAWWMARKRDVPIALSAHGTLPVRGGPKAIARRLYDRRWVGPMIRGADALLAQTDHEATLYERFGARSTNVHLLPLGVDPPPPDTDAILELGPPEGAKVVLFLGRIAPLKGIDRLITAFGQIAGAHPDAHLVIAGRDDGALDRSRSLAASVGLADRVHFPGPVYGVDRYAAYRRAAVFAITPTHFEESSLASLEAASVGTPVVVSAEADLPFIEEYGAGIRVDAGADPAPALDQALSGDPQAMGRAAQMMVTERHFWPVVAERLERILAA